MTGPCEERAISIPQLLVQLWRLRRQKTGAKDGSSSEGAHYPPDLPCHVSVTHSAGRLILRHHRSAASSPAIVHLSDKGLTEETLTNLPAG